MDSLENLPLDLNGAEAHIAQVARFQKITVNQVMESIWLKSVSKHRPADILQAFRSFFKFHIAAQASMGGEMNERSQNAIQIAVQNGYDIYLKNICKTSPQNAINSKGKNLWTALHYAAENGHLSCFKRLVRYHADINALLQDGRSCLHLAAAKGHIEIVQAILNNEVFTKLDAKAHHVGTALHSAITNRQEACVHLLATLPLLQTAIDGKGNTILHAAVNSANAQMVAAVLPYCQNKTNNLNSDQESPLLLAVLSRRVDVVEALLAANVVCDSLRGNRFSPVYQALANYFKYGATPANIRIKDNLLTAAKNQHVDLAKFADDLSGFSPKDPQLQAELAHLIQHLQQPVVQENQAKA